MRIAFFEDEFVDDLAPIALMRPVFELVCGQFTLHERLFRQFDVSDWGAFVRPELADVLREESPEAHVNDVNWLQQGSTLLINGRWLPMLESLWDIKPDETGFIGGKIAYITLSAEEAALLEQDEPAGAPPGFTQRADALGKWPPSGECRRMPCAISVGSHRPQSDAIDRRFSPTPVSVTEF